MPWRPRAMLPFVMPSRSLSTFLRKETQLWSRCIHLCVHTVHKARVFTINPYFFPPPNTVPWNYRFLYILYLLYFSFCFFRYSFLMFNFEICFRPLPPPRPKWFWVSGTVRLTVWMLVKSGANTMVLGVGSFFYTCFYNIYNICDLKGQLQEILRDCTDF